MGCMSSKEQPNYDYVHDNRTGRTVIRTRPKGYSTYQDLKPTTTRRHSGRVHAEDIQLHKQSRKPHQRRREREERDDRREERREGKAAAGAGKSKGATQSGDGGGEGPSRERRGAMSGDPDDGRVAQEARRVDQREQQASTSGVYYMPDEIFVMSGGRGGGAGPD